MKSTLITEDNAHLFIEGIPENVSDSADLLLGVIDEETDTACGVLAATADDVGNLQIAFIYVAESFRNKGAGKELLSSLKEIARDAGAMEISCIHERAPISDGVYELLEKNGYMLFDVATVSTYEGSLSDITVSEDMISSIILPVSELSDAQAKDLMTLVNDLARQDNYGCVLPLEEIPDYDKDHSFVCFSQGGKITGALLVGARSGEISIEGIYAFGKSFEKIKRDLVAIAKEAVEEDYGPNFQVLMRPYTREQFQEMDMLFGKKARKKEETVVQILAL